MSKQQYERVTFEALPRRWDSVNSIRMTGDNDERIDPEGRLREVIGYLDMNTPIEYTMIQANFATRKPHSFQRWHLDKISGKPYPESELVFFDGAWYRPEHIKDEIAEIVKRS